VIRRLLTVLGLAGLVIGSVGAWTVRGAGSAHAADSSPVVLIGTGGIMWSDVSPKATPNLWSLLRDGSSAALTVRSVNTNTCPVDGWLSLSAGQRAAAVIDSSDGKPPCPGIAGPSGGAVPGWAGFKAAAAAKHFDARLGLLAAQAQRSGACVQAVGPGAAIGAALPTGIVSRYSAFDHATLTANLTACPITLVDVGAMRDPRDVDPAEPRPTSSRADQVTAIDERIGQVLHAAPAGWDVIVASLSDAGESERLRLVAAKGPHFGAGTLVSPSTRQQGLVQAADVTVTLLAQAGLPVPDVLGGAALGRDPARNNSEALARERLRDLVDYDQASHEVHALVPPFFTGFAYSQVVIYAFVAIVWRRRFGSEQTRLRLLGIVRVVAVVAASVPVSTFLANLFPWWRFTVPMVAVVASVALFVAAISSLALLTPLGRTLMGPLAAVSAVTMAVLALDVMTGSRLQLSSLMGLQPVVGGRFYGMGNVTFALFGTGTILLCTALSHRLVLAHRRSLAAAVVAILGGAAVVVDGAPFWGADGGGPPALIPGVVYLALAILGVRMTWQRWVALGGTIPVLFLLVGFLDWLRPAESRTHLGRFFQTLIDGGAWDVVSRKFAQNMAILFGNYPLTLLIPVALVFVIYVLARPTSWGSRALQRSFDQAPTLRPGLIALAITLTIGFAVNDSGTAIPAVGATVAVPLIIAVSVRTLEDEARARPGTRAATRAAGRAPSAAAGRAPSGGDGATSRAAGPIDTGRAGRVNPGGAGQVNAGGAVRDSIGTVEVTPTGTAVTRRSALAAAGSAGAAGQGDQTPGQRPPEAAARRGDRGRTTRSTQATPAPATPPTNQAQGNQPQSKPPPTNQPPAAPTDPPSRAQTRAERRQTPRPTPPASPTVPPTGGTRGSGSRHAATSRRRGLGRKPKP
jgi:hypothetical protein